MFQIPKIIWCGIILFICAFIVRILFISYPSEIVFDEGINIRMAQDIKRGQGFFDNHPPLAHIIDSILIVSSETHQITSFAAGESMRDIPYVRLRILRVILGSLLPVIVIAITYKLHKRERDVFLVGLLVAFDPARITYSRLILPDILLLFFGFLGILLFLHKKTYIAFFFIGLAVAVKWTALGFAFVPLIYLLYKRKFLLVASASAIIVATYILVFISFFILLDHRIPFDNFSPNLPTAFHNNILPLSYTPLEIIKTLPKYNITMYQQNNFFGEHLFVSSPYEWLIGEKSILMWFKNREAIWLVPNVISWIFMLSSVIFGLIFLLRKKAPEYMPWILLGYGINIIPFFFLGRSLFVYHYFTALIIGFLCVPFLLEYLAERFFSPRAIVITGIITITLFFIIASPFIYGFAFL